MGAAPETVQEAELTPQEARAGEQEWFLDADAGELRPEGAAEGDPRDQPTRVRVARWLFD